MCDKGAVMCAKGAVTICVLKEQCYIVCVICQKEKSHHEYIYSLSRENIFQSNISTQLHQII